jgi:ATP-dependent DNA helicase RecG
VKLSQTLENQNVEFKSIWKDDFLKHICAFSNSKGGTLFVGVDDKGTIVGIGNSKKLLEDIPNKAIQFLGVTIAIDVNKEGNKYYLAIFVNPSPSPIAFKGRYYIRSGSTVQELSGNDLQHFILKKLGKSYDELPIESATINDIDALSVRKFIKMAIKINRLSVDAEEDELQTVLFNLKLIGENSKLKNAAILLFGKNTPHYFSSVSFRIGKFGNNHHDLKFHDVIEGNIFEMPEKVMEILKSKYLTMPIRYEGIKRIEELEYPEEALREAILNAIIHRDYTGVHIQLSVYENKIILWNPGSLPSKINIDRLKEKHPSIPKNRLIADIFFKAGYIEAWGRGIHKIVTEFMNAKLPEPIFENYAGGVQVTLLKDLDRDLDRDLDKDLDRGVLTNNQIQILKEIEKNKDITQMELSRIIGINDKNIRNNIKKLKDLGLIERIGNTRTGYWKIIQK